MYTEEAKTMSSNVIDEISDFNRILKCLKEETTYAHENSAITKDVVNSIKPMEEKTSPKEVASTTPNCLVDYLWQEILYLKMINRETRETLIHLQKVIGG